MTRDDEGERFAARARRYANLGVNAGAFAARSRLRYPGLPDAPPLPWAA